MATSGSVDFSVSRDNILTDSLILAGAVGPDDSVPANWTTHAARQLNKVVKALGARGPALWAKSVGYILPVSDTNEVSLGSTGGHATLSYTVTQTASSASAGATSISVDSATGIADTYYIGIELEDGSMQWTTVSGAPSGTTVTLASALTDDVDADAMVYVYQTKLVRPLRIVEAYLRTHTDASTWTEHEMWVLAKQEYEIVGNKQAEGLPNQLSYEPLLDNGKAYIYPRFSDGQSVIKVVFQRPFEDFDATTDTPDFPQEWYDPLCLLLAVRLAPVYGMPSDDRTQLKQDAAEALNHVLGNEPEEGSYRIMPAFHG